MSGLVIDNQWMHTLGHGKLMLLHCVCSDDISHPLYLKSPPVLFALPMDPVCEITLCCKWSCLSLYSNLIMVISQAPRKRAHSSWHTLQSPWWSYCLLSLVVCVQSIVLHDHVAGKRVPPFIMKQHNLSYLLAHDKPSPFNFWTFAMKCSTRMLTYCLTPYLTLPEMQLDIVNEMNFSYLRAPQSLTSKVW